MEHVNIRQRVIELAGAVDEILFRKALSGLAALTEGSDVEPLPITIVLNTTGGDSHQALAIYELIKSTAVPICIHVIGACMLAGITILQAARPGLRAATPLSHLMIHYGSAEVASESDSKYVKRLDQLHRQILVERTGKSKRTVNRWHNGETYFSAKQAIEAGLIDVIKERI